MRRRPPDVSLDPDGIPLALLAGRCIEVWAGPGGDWHDAFRRWADARRRYLSAQGLARNTPQAQLPEPLEVGVRPTPWSYTYLLAEDPERLAAKLAHLGLPPDWTPSPADPEDFGEAVR